MRFDLSFVTEQSIVFWAVVSFCLLLVVTLSLIERKLSKKLEDEKRKVNFFQEKISALKKANEKPERLFILLDELVKDFFKDTYNLDYEMPYYDRIEFFTKTGNRSAEKFCEIMQEAMYGGETMDAHKIQVLLKSFENYVEEEKKMLILNTPKKDFISHIPFIAIFRRLRKKKRITIPLSYEEKKQILKNLEIKANLQKDKFKSKKTFHDNVHSVDNLNRIERKINQRKKIEKNKTSLF